MICQNELLDHMGIPPSLMDRVQRPPQWYPLNDVHHLGHVGFFMMEFNGQMFRTEVYVSVLELNTDAVTRECERQLQHMRRMIQWVICGPKERFEHDA